MKWLKIVKFSLLVVCLLQIAMIIGCSNPCPALLKCRRYQYAVSHGSGCKQISRGLCCQYHVVRVWCLNPPFVGYDWWGGAPYRNKKCRNGVVCF